MVVRKKGKHRKRLGSRTHGWGLQHRAGGQQGGVGRAGSGKRADCKKPSFWGVEFGRHGFFSRFKKSNCINLKDIEDRLDHWIADGSAEVKAGAFIVDLEKMGYDKVLGTGVVTKKLSLKVAKASPSAVKKIEAAGGNIVA